MWGTHLSLFLCLRTHLRQELCRFDRARSGMVSISHELPHLCFRNISVHLLDKVLALPTPACMYFCGSHVCSASRGLKRTSDLLDLELQMVLSCTWVLGTQLGSSARAANVLNHRAISYPEIDVLNKGLLIKGTFTHNL